jgi:hypothetical protein
MKTLYAFPLLFLAVAVKADVTVSNVVRRSEGDAYSKASFMAEGSHNLETRSFPNTWTPAEVEAEINRVAAEWEKARAADNLKTIDDYFSAKTSWTVKTTVEVKPK